MNNKLTLFSLVIFSIGIFIIAFSAIIGSAASPDITGKAIYYSGYGNSEKNWDIVSNKDWQIQLDLGDLQIYFNGTKKSSKGAFLDPEMIYQINDATFGNKTLNITYLSTNAVNPAVIAKSAKLNGFWNNTDLELITKENGFKEEITLKNANAPKNLTFNMTYPIDVIASQEGSAVYFGPYAGIIFWKINDPFLEDSEGNRLPMSVKWRYQGATPNYNWGLLDYVIPEGNYSYPLTIDPAVLSGGIITVNGTDNNLRTIWGAVNNATALNCDTTNTGLQPEGIGFNCTMRASLIINGSMDMSRAWLYVNGTASQFYIDIISGGGNFGNLSIRNFSHITSNTTQDSDFYVRNGARLDANHSNFSYIAGSTSFGMDIADTAGRVTIRHSFFNNTNSIQLNSAQYVLILNTSFSGTAAQIASTSGLYNNLTNITIDAISSAIGMSMNTKTNHTYLKGVNITNAPGTALNFATNNGGTNNTLEDVTISGQTGAAQFSISDAASNTILLNSRITCGNGDICIQTTGSNLNVTNTQILLIPTAVGLYVGGNGANITKNLFTQVGSVIASINISSRDNRFENNTFNSVFRGIRLTGASNTNLSYNQFNNIGLVAYSFDSDQPRTTRIENDTIVMASGVSDAIYVGDGNDLIFQNLTITGSGNDNSYGIRLNAVNANDGNHTIANVTIDNFEYGIYGTSIGSEDIIIRHSNISRATNVSIEATTGATGWTIDNVNITAEGNLGLRVGETATNFNFTNVTVDTAGNVTLLSGQGVNFTLSRVRSPQYPTLTGIRSTNRYFNATNLSAAITWMNITVFYSDSDYTPASGESALRLYRNLTTNSTGWERQVSTVINPTLNSAQLNISDYSVWLLAMQANAPRWSNENVTPISPAQQANNYQFQITWTPQGGDTVGTTQVEIDGTNYTATGTGNSYSFTWDVITRGQLNVSDHNYRWYANDSSGNQNTTGFLTYTISVTSSGAGGGGQANSGCFFPLTPSPAISCQWNQVSCQWDCPSGNQTIESTLPISGQTIADFQQNPLQGIWLFVNNIIQSLISMASWGLSIGPTYQAAGLCGSGFCLPGTAPFAIPFVGLGIAFLAFVLTYNYVVKTDKLDRNEAIFLALGIAIIALFALQMLRTPLS